VGVDFTRGICGVSIIRSGEAMETALRECCQGIKLGKILVHRWGQILVVTSSMRVGDCQVCLRFLLLVSISCQGIQLGKILVHRWGQVISCNKQHEARRLSGLSEVTAACAHQLPGDPAGQDSLAHVGAVA
jgi:hypothetical protein